MTPQISDRGLMPRAWSRSYLVAVVSYPALVTAAARHRDLALAMALCGGGEYELLAPVTYDGAAVWPGPVAANAILIPLLTLPLALRRRWPTAVCWYVLGGLALISAVFGG